ncbi:hypothetical protein COT29_02590 [Candidatus Micrarchaeota archaeon CG08_land_8_20_14_0_20_59_11]|nr:MAG: hypothetical protein COT29_02590 [Candidatus Micrarchaeota archaeon CG08_land_8_20_14_0_20_59_11]
MDVIRNLEKSLSYAWNLGHVKPFLYLYLLAAVGLGALAAIGFGALAAALAAPAGLASLIPTAAWLVLLLILLAIVVAIGSLLAIATVALQSQGKKKAFGEAKKRLLGLISVMFAVILVSFAANWAVETLLGRRVAGASYSGGGALAAVAGTIVSIAVSCAFVFTPYFVILRGRKALDALSASAKLFVKKPAAVFLVFLTEVVVGIALVIASLVPLVLAIAYAASAGATSLLVSGLLVFLSLFVLLLGISFTQTFGAAFLANALVELDRKR